MFRGSEHNVACDNNRKSIGNKGRDDGTIIQQLESRQKDKVSLKLESVDRAVNPSVTRVIVNGGRKKDRPYEIEYKSANNTEFISAGYISTNLNKKYDEKVLLERKSDTKHDGQTRSLQNSVKVTNCVSTDRNIDKAQSVNFAARMQPEPTNLSHFSENKEKQLLWCAKSASDRDKLTTKADEDEQHQSSKAPNNNTRSLGFGSRIKLDNNNNTNNSNGITSGSSRRRHLANHKWNSSWQLTDSNKKVLDQKRTISELNLTSLCPLENARTREQLLIDKTRSSVKAMPGVENSIFEIENIFFDFFGLF